MNDFLQKAKAALANLNKFEFIQVVLGNESCDLDSVVSSLCYAFFLHKQTPDNTVIPVLNITQEEFPFRTETIFFLNENNVCCDNLIFRDNIDLQLLCNDGKLQLILVDHHVLPVQDQILASCVRQVIDHRPQDKGMNWPDVNVNINLVGSCCTLISKIILETHPQALDCVVACLLHGTIILDTVNFNIEANRFKQLDKDMLQVLQEKFQKTRSDEETLKILVEARCDISTLSSVQLLQRDLKIIGNLPISGLPISAADFANRSDAKEALSQFCKMKDVQVTMVMGMVVQNDAVLRDIGLYSLNECELQQRLFKCLENCEELCLEKLECNLVGLHLYQQNNVKLSRKHIVPILTNCMNS